MINIGMDVHVRNSFVHAADGRGRKLLSGRCGHSLAELAERLAPIEKLGEPVRVVLESTTNSRPIARLLERYGQEAGLDLTAPVLDARKLKIIAESFNKTDRLDAAVLCELAGSNLKLPVCHMPDEEVFALREHLRARSDLVRLRTMLKNRVHALLHRRNLLTPMAGLFTRAGRSWLGQQELDEAGRSILGRYLEGVDGIDKLIGESTGQLRDLSRQERWAKPAALLRTLPGVGLLTALTVLAELGDWSRFRGRASVSAYAGLVPRQHDSNDKHRGGHISRQGPAHLRSVLVEAAWTAQARVPRYRRVYETIKQRRNSQTAIVAVARRMLEDLYTMLRKDQAFRFDASRPTGRVAPSAQVDSW